MAKNKNNTPAKLFAKHVKAMSDEAVELATRNNDDGIASEARMELGQRQTRHVVSLGVCPVCGRELRRNWSIAGWWQCSQFGAIGFRAEVDKPSCDWQGFTE